MCVLVAHTYVFNLNVGPLSSQNKECFSLWFLSQQPQCDSQQRHIEKKKKKKSHVSLQNILLAHRSGNIWERDREQRGRQSVSTQEAMHTDPCTLASNKPHITMSRVNGVSQTSPKMSCLSSAQRVEAHFTFAAWVSIWLCGGLLQHPRLLLNTQYEQLIHEVASCILFEKYDTPPKLSTRCLIHIHSPICKCHCFNNTSYTFRTWFSHLTWKIKVKMSRA